MQTGSGLVGTLAIGLLALWLPALALADAAPSPPSFNDCTANYRAKGDTTCVECAQEWVGDDDSAGGWSNCADQLADTDFFYVCSEETPAFPATEVWCDGDHKGDCACTLDPGVPTWPAGLLAGLGLAALALRRTLVGGRG